MRFWLLTLCLCLFGCGETGQSDDCKKWVACSDALPGATRGSQDAAFGPMGACWMGSAKTASDCTASCKEAVMQRASQPNAPAQCT